MTLAMRGPKSPLSISLLISGSVHLGLFAFFASGFHRFSLPKNEPIALEIVSTIVQGTNRPAVKVEKKVGAPKLVAQETESALPQNTEAPLETATQQVIATSSAPNARLAENAQEQYISEITRLLNSQKKYPEMARKLRQEGRVLLQFRLAKDGSILEANIVTPSTYALLNQSAENLIKQINGLKPFPNEINKTTWLFTVPVDYRM